MHTNLKKHHLSKIFLSFILTISCFLTPTTAQEITEENEEIYEINEEEPEVEEGKSDVVTDETSKEEPDSTEINEDNKNDETYQKEQEEKENYEEKGDDAYLAPAESPDKPEEEIVEVSFDPLDESTNQGEILSALNKKSNRKSGAKSAPVLSYEWFEPLILNGIQNKETNISIQSYSIPYNDENSKIIFALETRFTFEHPELFYVKQNGFTYYTNGTFAALRLLFLDYSEDEINAFNSKCNSIVAQMNSNLSDTEKTLFIHDYIVTHCDFDNTLTKRTAYDALITGSSVCQGYALAFEYLMRLAGGTCETIVSDEISHAWNSVTLEGKKYFLDATWDDPESSDSSNPNVSLPLYRNYCQHNNFLVNSATLATNHGGTDWTNMAGENVRYAYTDTMPINIWEDNTSALAGIGREWIYFDRNNEKYYTYNFQTGVTTQINWTYVSSPWPWHSGYGGLASSDENFYFSRHNRVYEVSPSDHTAHILKEFSSSELNGGYIYGIRISRTATEVVLEADIYSDWLSTNFIETKYITLKTINYTSISINTSSPNSVTGKIFPNTLTEKEIRALLRNNSSEGTLINNSGTDSTHTFYNITPDSNIFVTFSELGFVPIVKSSNTLNDGDSFNLIAFGDADGNGDIDVSDLALASAFILANSEITNENTDAADYNRTGEIDVADLSGISYKILAS